MSVFTANIDLGKHIVRYWGFQIDDQEDLKVTQTGMNACSRLY